MESSQLNGTREIRESLKAQRAEARQRFRRNLARLDSETRRQLANPPYDLRSVYKKAARHYVQLLADFHGIRALQGALGFLVMRQWQGSPVVDVWGNADRRAEEWRLRMRVWIHPDGQCWEAREVGSLEKEELDEANRVLYFNQTEPYHEPKISLLDSLRLLFGMERATK